MILRTHQHVRLRVGRRGRIEGDGGDSLARTLRAAGATLSPLCARPRGGAHQAVADLGCYFGVHAAADGLDPDLTDRLREHAVVEFAYDKPPVALPTAPGARTTCAAARATSARRPTASAPAPPGSGPAAPAAACG